MALVCIYVCVYIRTIFVSNGLADCHARLLVGIVHAHSLRDLNAEPMQWKANLAAAVSRVFHIGDTFTGLHPWPQKLFLRYMSVVYIGDSNWKKKCLNFGVVVGLF